MIRTARAHMVIFGVLLSSFVAICSNAQTPLTVEMGEPVQYQSDTGERFVARYGSLSDGSLHFVKVKMPDGKEYTLPQVVSGSGVRYTDEREIVWWSHHGTVRVDVRDAEGKWNTRYSELTEIPKEK